LISDLIFSSFSELLHHPLEEDFIRVPFLNRQEQVRVLHESLVEVIHASLKAHQCGFSHPNVCFLEIKAISLVAGPNHDTIGVDGGKVGVGFDCVVFSSHSKAVSIKLVFGPISDEFFLGPSLFFEPFE